MIAAVGRGEALPAAARRLGVKMSTAYTWIHRSKGVVPAPTFIELVTAGAATTSSGLVVRVGGAEIEVHTGFDAGLLRELVSALAEGAP